MAAEQQQPPQQQGKQYEKLPSGIVIGPDGKPCKVCSDLKALQKAVKRKHDDGSSQSSSKTAGSGVAAAFGAAVASTPAKKELTEQERERQCPPDIATLGRHTWTFLHSTAAYYPATALSRAKADSSESGKPYDDAEAHRGAATQMLSLLRSLPYLYPCGMCADDLAKFMRLRPPEKHGGFTIDSATGKPIKADRSALEKYLCDVHNDVNKRLGKPLFDCSKVGERWREGPPDGRCD